MPAARGLVIVAALLVACGAADRQVLAPVDPHPRLQLLRCTPAPRPPVLADDGVSFGGLTKAENLELERSGRTSTAAALKVIPGSPTVIGVYDRAVLARAISTELKGFSICYAREIARNPNLVARLEVAFTVEADGRVSKVSAGRAAPGLSVCVTRIVGGLSLLAPPAGAVRVSYPFTFDHAGAPVPDGQAAVEPVPAPVPWTPFSLETSPPIDTAPAIARATEIAIRRRLDPIGACFSGPAPTGSLRLMLDLDPAGGLRAVRVGGLGDPASEVCIRRTLDGLDVASPTLDSAEIACDLSRGDAQRWRINVADYEVITTTRTSIAHAGITFELDAGEPDPLPPNHSYVILVQRDTPGTVLELAVGWVFEGDATLIATQRGSSAPVLVGVARSTFALGDAHDDPGAVEVSLEVTRGRVAACVASVGEDAALADPKAVDALLARLAARCRRVSCVSTIGLAVESGATASGLVEVADAARRAGFERVLIDGGTGCRVAHSNTWTAPLHTGGAVEPQ